MMTCQCAPQLFQPTMMGEPPARVALTHAGSNSLYWSSKLDCRFHLPVTPAFSALVKTLISCARDVNPPHFLLGCRRAIMSFSLRSPRRPNQSRALSADAMPHVPPVTCRLVRYPVSMVRVLLDVTR